jgi:hypothetical protein
MMPVAFMAHSIRRSVFALVALCAMRAEAKADSGKAIQEFREGRALVVAGKCDEAIPHFRASLAIAPAVGPLMNLGECEAKLGKTASAVRAFDEAAALAREQGDTERAGESERMVATLRPAISTLTVRGPATQVLIDGQLQPVGVAIPLDGGDHQVVSDVSGERRTTTIHLGATGDARVFDLPEPAPAPRAPKPSPPPPPEESHRLRTGSYIAAGAGVVGLTVGTILGVTVLGSRSDLDEMCPAYPTCPASARSRVMDVQNGADTRATFSTIALTAGALFAATAVVLYVLDASGR